MHEFGPLDGALLIDKPVGPTSHDVVDAIRREFQIKKAGHCGTLDPNATGLLVIVLGRGTKLSEKLMATDKVYEGALRLGETTTSYDADGEMTASLPVPPLTLEQLNEVAATFIGDQMQLPPMVSAVKKDGVPLYKLARKGIEVERKERLIHIYNFRFSTYEEPVGAPKAPTSAPSRTISAKKSVAGVTWRRCGGSPPANSTWLTHCPSIRCWAYPAPNSNNA